MLEPSVSCRRRPTIIFDFDGTLANSLDPAMDYLFNVILPQHKIKLSPAKIKQLRNKSIWQIAGSLPFSFWKIPKMLLEVKKWHDENLHLVELYPEIPNMIHQLKKADFRLMILTSNSVANVQQILQRSGLEDNFVSIRESKGLFNKPQALRNIINDYEITAAEALYVGDEIRDIRACHQAGVPIIAVTYGLNGATGLKKNKPQYLADSPQAVVEVALKTCLI